MANSHPPSTAHIESRIAELEKVIASYQVDANVTTGSFAHLQDQSLRDLQAQRAALVAQLTNR